MRAFSLHPGVWFNAASAIITGGGAVTGVTATGLIELFGWASVALGIGLFLWGIRINERHIWQQWWIRPIRNKNDLAKMRYDKNDVDPWEIKPSGTDKFIMDAVRPVKLINAIYGPFKHNKKKKKGR
ncbi:MAG: hypothetical protein WA910_10525 [Sphingopyxis granuli]